MIDQNKLRGAIYSKYPSISAFSKDSHYPEQRLRRILRATQKPDANDIYLIGEILELSISEIEGIFLPLRSNKSLINQ